MYKSAKDRLKEKIQDKKEPGIVKRVRLVVAYDGTNYCGWQSQNNGVAVQDVLNRHLSELLGEPIETIGASRTDAGVHALGNVAVFDTDHRMPAEKISYALNARLPEDIRIQKSEEVAADFHPRYCTSVKTYEYKILNRQMQIPTLRHYAHFTYVPLDVELMRQGAEYLIGEHDFKSFCGTGAQVKTTVREVLEIEFFQESISRPSMHDESEYACDVFEADNLQERTVQENKSIQSSGIGDAFKASDLQEEAAQGNKSIQSKGIGDVSDADDLQEETAKKKDMHAGEIITMRIKGKGFLYNMVRIIAGTLMEVGRGKYSPEHMKAILDACDRGVAGPTAPARGLTLVGIEYKE